MEESSEFYVLVLLSTFSSLVGDEFAYFLNTPFLGRAYTQFPITYNDIFIRLW